MKLPHAERAEVDPEKVLLYLLSDTHPVGWSKARFFVSLGYSPGDWQRLRVDLLRLAREGDASPWQASRFGVKHEVRGRLSGPVGRIRLVASVWIVLSGEDVPRLVTVYPV